MRYLILLAMLLLMNAAVCAQPGERQKRKCAYVKSEFDIEWNIPKGFYVGEEDNLVYGPNLSRKSGAVYGGFTYWMTALSQGGDCKLLYPLLTLLTRLYQREPGDGSAANIQLQNELFGAVNDGLPPYHEAWLKPEWAKYITAYGGEKARRDFNADPVFVVDFPIIRPFQDKYTYCLGIYLKKSGYFPVFLKCLLTDQGYREKEQYLDAARQAVKYGDGPWNYDRKKIEEAYSKVMKEIGNKE
ncbi:hypothetical protein [Prevotella sp. KH2C16]|uniref:hypothetical protein n=1 Tax=Prevotella sp. KH2C16 TaxID=1855325 RepID=UPI0008EA89DD|nr:hypothetical protein [Prevotella sp. KH2C16]SFG17701.1 hypothetical protein SAMN05216383_106113 [Prevotella sp. KH2C16]